MRDTHKEMEKLVLERNSLLDTLNYLQEELFKSGKKNWEAATFSHKQELELARQLRGWEKELGRAFIRGWSRAFLCKKRRRIFALERKYGNALEALLGRWRRARSWISLSDNNIMKLAEAEDSSSRLAGQTLLSRGKKSLSCSSLIKQITINLLKILQLLNIEKIVCDVKVRPSSFGMKYN